MPWVPRFPGERPTLGFYVIDWMAANLATPDAERYRPFRVTREQAEFLIRFYEINPNTGKRKIRRGVMSRSRGWGKALALDTPIVTLGGWQTMGSIQPGDVVFDENGQRTVVVAKSPVWDDTDAYRVTYSDGESFIASAQHLWTLYDNKVRQWRTIDTAELCTTHPHHRYRSNQVRLRPPGPRDLTRTRTVAHVTPVGVVPTQCIQVSGDSGQFLIGQTMVATHNSPLMSAIAVTESLADVVPAGWDANGRPVGMPWRRKRTPLTVLAAATEEQVMRNTWAPLVEMLDETLSPPVYENYPGLQVMKGGVQLPGRGLIIPASASATSVKGMRGTFQVADQTESWGRSNSGHAFYNTLVDNATKVGSAIIETPNAFVPGEDSVAERSAQAYFAMIEGRARITDGLLYDHREAPGETDLTEHDSLIAGIRYAYGDSSAHPDGCVLHDPPCPPGWVDVDGVLQRMWDPDAEEGWSRGNWLNQIQHPTDAYIAQYEWRAIEAPGEGLRPGDVITLGFDGSRGKAFGKPDATALVACRVSDGLLTALWVDEATDDKSTWLDWQPNIVALEAALHSVFNTYRVAAFYADPGKDWRSHVNAWEARFAQKTLVKRGAHPFEWWMTGGRDLLVEKAVLQFAGAVRNHDVSHDGGYRLAAHVLAARSRVKNGKLQVQKSSKYSVHKIDACIAAILAWQARADAISAGALQWNTRRSYTFEKM